MSMRDAELVTTTVLLDRPKRFVCEILRMPDGNEIDWYYADTPESVMVVPVTNAGDVVLVQQYRHNLKMDTLELPAGTAGSKESLETAALRELVEETGHTLDDPSILQFLGKFYALPSETNKYVNIFLATPVSATHHAEWDTEIEKYFDMGVVVMPFEKAIESIGVTIQGIETAGALMLAKARLAS